jgi:DNA polymerase III delta prime subunit
LNTAAANKLLKLLEEPTEKTVFILISETRKIIQTIRLQASFQWITQPYRRSLKKKY